MLSKAFSNAPAGALRVRRRILRRLRPLRGLFRPRARDESDACADAQEAIAAIERLLASMESEFQTLSESLIDCFARSKSIAGDAGALPAMLGEGEGSIAGGALQEILDLAEGMHSRCGEASRLLGEVCTSTSHLGKGIASRRQFLSTFQVMQTMSQIEIARLDTNASDFGALGEEMSALAVRVREETARIGDLTRALGQSAWQAAARARAIEAVEERSLPELTSGARRGLEALLASRAAAAHASSAVAERYANVSGAVQQLVSSMQSHDIARQQLEHVVESLRPIAAGDVSGASRNATLQVAHVWHARESFVGAADRIVSSLAEISNNVAAISTEAATLLGPEREEQGTHSSAVERNVEGILQALARFQASEANIAASAASVLSGIEAISGSVGEVQAIGVRMQRIALNSSIQSSQLGEAGAPLGVLADLARTLATDAESWAEAASLDLGIIAAHGGALSAIASQAASEGASQLAGTAERMRGVLAALNERDRSGCEQIGVVQKQAGALQAKIEMVRDTIAIQRRVVESTDECISSLQRTIAATDNAGLGPADLVQISARYSMSSEREIHRRLSETAGDLAPAQVLTAIAETDNVELF
ncbi:MAG: hypothetical protein ABSF98_16845 [Bryobacteraceae bacterium]